MSLAAKIIDNLEKSVFTNQINYYLIQSKKMQLNIVWGGVEN